MTQSTDTAARPTTPVVTFADEGEQVTLFDGRRGFIQEAYGANGHVEAVDVVFADGWTEEALPDDIAIVHRH